VVVDAGAGEGNALVALGQHWNRPQTLLLGVELDEGRATKADRAFKPDGMCLWSSIEDASLIGSASVLWFNPPYDTVRGGTSMEEILFNHCASWPEPGGLIVVIVQESLLHCGWDSNLARALNAQYEKLGVWRYPEEERQQWGQCVYIGRRRPTRNVWADSPSWSENKTFWDDLPLAAPKPLARAPLLTIPRLHRKNISADILKSLLPQSPLSGFLVSQAANPALQVERPLLPLRPGHLALAVAGGLCDGILHKDGHRFLVKGTLHKGERKREEDVLDADGHKVGVKERYRTRWNVRVKLLREDANLRTFDSKGEDEHECGESESHVSTASQQD
jgi:hypothetical protein